MIYDDRLYGKVKITEPVILDLIKSKTIQRLKDIEQGGYTPLYTNPRKLPLKQLMHKRFEHSLGVFILLKKFEAPLTEQIAGLIHDISHGVFSHSSDAFFGRSATQDHGDKIFNIFFKKSGLPKILKKYGYQPNYFLNKKHFPILEKDLPDLCADRIDYILMTALRFEEMTKKELSYFLTNLNNDGQQWFFKNFKSAKKFAYLFKKINDLYLSDLKSAAMHRLVSNTLIYAIKKKYLKKVDIFTTDSLVLKKLRYSSKKDKILKNFLFKMKGHFQFENNPMDYQYFELVKSRVVDPLFQCGNQLKRFSQVDKNWKKVIKQELKPKKYFLKLY